MSTQNLPVIKPPADDPQWGPAMRALPTDRMRAYVIAALETGSSNATKLARMAGYAENGIRPCAHRLAHDPRILAALREEGERRLQSAAIMAASRVVAIAEATTDEKVALKACEMIFNRVGLHAVTEVRNLNMSDGAGQIERIATLAQKLGLDPRVLLGRYGVKKLPDGEATVIDAEATEVKRPHGNSAEAKSRAGLEDLL